MRRRGPSLVIVLVTMLLASLVSTTALAPPAQADSADSGDPIGDLLGGGNNDENDTKDDKDKDSDGSDNSEDGENLLEVDESDRPDEPSDSENSAETPKKSNSEQPENSDGTQRDRHAVTLVTSVVQDVLRDLLPTTDPKTKLPVLVHGNSTSSAGSAVRKTGLDVLDAFDPIGVVSTKATPRQVKRLSHASGVTYLETDQPLEYTQFTSHQATRGEHARRTMAGADGHRLDGHGVSVAVIDTGVDGTHPFLTDRDGSSAVVRNLKASCLAGVLTGPDCFVDTPTNDSDTISAGGHGTHVAGIVAGRDTKIGDRSLHGAAPGANIVALSVGLGVTILEADNALAWVLENHEHPCGPGVSQSVCPPIKVVNNSYGPSGGGEFDPRSATVKLQRKLAAEGVAVVWAAGNDGGTGSDSRVNPPGQDPTGGIVSAAAYNDLGTGSREGGIAGFSSRGRQGQPSTYPDISAPGQNITSSCRQHLPICASGSGSMQGGDFNNLSGTSMSAPHISGIAAQLFQAAPWASPGQVEDAMKATAYKYSSGAPYEPAGPYTTSYDKGTGLVDVPAAVNYLR